MKTIVVKSKDELKAALKGNATEIIVEDSKLIRQLRAIRRLRKAGPVAIGLAIAAISLIPATGGVSGVASAVFLTGGAGASTGTGISGLGIAGLCVAIGGTVVISIFTDWEDVEIAGVFKLKRKAKKA